MDPESKKLLEETLRLVEENNEIIKKIRSVQRRQVISRTAYWILIIGAAVGAFYFVQPYIDGLQSFLHTAGFNVEGLNNFFPNKPQ